MRTPTMSPTAALLLACATVACSGSPEHGLGFTPRFITDAQGRALILHGVNVANSTKSDPLRVPTGFDATDVQHIAVDWDFNFVRYLILWDALEPMPSMIDQAYLDRVQAELDLFTGQGVHVLLDMHQDVYSADFCCDGAPSWAIEDDGLAFQLQSAWYTNYFQPAVVAAFDNFFDYGGDHPELQDHYLEAWAAVAERFATHPAVIGYDLMNEPYAGSYFDSVEALGGYMDPLRDSPRSQTFDVERLGPFYQRVIDRIREVDADSWLFFEPRYAAPGNGSPSYLPHLDDPRPGDPHLVYAPHLYSLSLEAQGGYTANDLTVSRWETQRGVDLGALETPLVMGEWGIQYGTTNGDAFLQDVLSMSDRMLAGWSYWSYDPGGFGLMDGMGVDRPTVDVVSRPYPRAVAGIPTAFAYDPATRVFTLSFDEKPGVTGPTEISIPAARHYPDGWELATTDAMGSWSSSFDDVREILSYVADPTVASHTLEIHPLPAP